MAETSTDPRNPEDNPSDSEQSAAAWAKVPQFSEAALDRSLWVDAALRWAALAVMIFGLGALMGYEVYAQHSASLTILLAGFAAVAGWVAVSTINARASQQLPQISMMIEADPAAAEDSIAHNLRRRPLLRWVRLMFYHRLAVLRHRQHHYAEVSAICQSILARPLGPARSSRPHLLLMLAESQLESRDFAGAWSTLNQLHYTRLALSEALQRMALQTRYEVATGADGAALDQITEKIEMAELLPAGQCGALHALLAIAAQRQQQGELAAWLWARVHLLCEPSQVDKFTNAPSS